MLLPNSQQCTNKNVRSWLPNPWSTVVKHHAQHNFDSKRTITSLSQGVVVSNPDPSATSLPFVSHTSLSFKQKEDLLIALLQVISRPGTCIDKLPCQTLLTCALTQYSDI